MLYYILFTLCLFLVLSTKINTNNTLKLIGIGFIAVGCLVSMEKGQSILIEIGILFYFLSNLLHAYFGNKKRRLSDYVNE